MTSVKKIGMLWTSVVLFAFTFLFVYTVVPFFFKMQSSFYASFGAGAVAVILRFWGYMKLEQ